MSGRAVARRVAAAALLALGLTACVAANGRRTDLPPNSTVEVQPDGSRRIVVETDLQIWDERATERLMARRETTAREANALLSDRTRLTWSPGHGTQVEYTSADGRAFLVYPGNRSVLPGRWSTREITTEYRRAGKVLRVVRSAAICYAYGGNTYNPVTGHAGSSPECQPFESARRTEVETARGDPLGLARSTTPPVVVGPERTTLGALRAAARRS